MIMFNKTKYGYTFASEETIKYFISQIKKYIGGLMEIRDAFKVHCPCEVYQDEEGNNGTMPVYGTKLAACADVCSPKQVIIEPGKAEKIDLLIGFDIPFDHKIIMYPRSSLLIKKGLFQPVSVIDPDYSRMHVHVPLFNMTNEPVTIERGERIAQIECVPRYEELGQTWVRKEDVRTGGFGSTGK